MPLIFSAVFRDGHKVAQPTSVSDALAVFKGAAPGGQRPDGTTVLVALDRPDPPDLVRLGEHIDVPDGVLTEVPREYRRAGFERYDDALVVQLRPATYDDAREEVEFGHVEAVLGNGVFGALTQGRAEDTELVRESLRQAQRSPELLSCGPLAALYGLFESVADSYLPVVRGLEEDIDQIEEELFAGRPGVSRRIYELFNEVIDFQRATRPFLDLLDDVEQATETQLGAPTDEDDPRASLRRRLRRVRERVTRVVERSDTFRAQLQNALGVNQALVAQQQNEDMKRISGWAAILFAPTLVAGIYGMNFAVMPELQWRLGYPYALGLMVVLTLGFYTVFKLKKWF